MESWVTDCVYCTQREAAGLHTGTTSFTGKPLSYGVNQQLVICSKDGRKEAVFWPERAASHRLQISTTSFWEDRTVGLTVTQLPDRMHFWDFRLLQIRFLTYLIRFSLLDWPGVNCWSKYRISILPFLKLYKQFCSQNLNPCAPMWNWDQLRDVNRSSVINESTVLQFLKLDGLYTSYSTTKLWDT